MKSALVIFVALLFVLSPAVAEDVRIEVVKLDGGHVVGTWAGVGEGGGVQITTGQGPLTIAQNDLLRVSFDWVSSSIPTPANSSDDLTVFRLADGGRLFGGIIETGEESIVICTEFADAITISFDRLAGVQLQGGVSFVEARKKFEEALADRLPGQDVLITRELDDVRSVRGRLVKLGPQSGSFSIGGKARSFSREKIYGIVMAAGLTQLRNYAVTCVLIGGAEISGQLEGADVSAIRLQSSLGTLISLPLGKIKELVFHSDRVVYLSDLTPTKRMTEGLVHRPWPVRRDQNVATGPIALGGTTYAKGLGVHSRTELVYELGGDYESLAATVGIDDMVRPRGAVEFIIRGQKSAGKKSSKKGPDFNSGNKERVEPPQEAVLYQSGPLTGRNKPQALRVDVSGIQRLTLLVDYGLGWDIADYANWADVRLIKPEKAEAP